MTSRSTAETVRVPSPRPAPAVEVRSARTRSAAFDRLWREIGPAEDESPDGRRRTLDW